MPAAVNGPRCTKIKKDGTRCKNAPIRGASVCSAPGHGGSLPVVKQAAARRVAQAEAHAEVAKLASANGISGRDLDPVEALFDIAAEILTWQRTVNNLLTEISATDWRRDHRAGEQIHAYVTLFERSLDRSAKILVELNKLGLEERRIRIAEREIALVGQALTAALDRAGIDGGTRRVISGYLADELNKAQAAEDARAASPNNSRERTRTGR